MAAAGGSNIGLRKNNEDNYYMNQESGMFVVADGMGGHEHGQLASRLAVEQFETYCRQATTLPPSLTDMRQIIEEANRSIYQLQKTMDSGIIGTTVTAAMVQERQVCFGHVGDSRLYLLRQSQLMQLTQDHSYYAELLRQGSQDLQIAQTQRNVLLKALGPEATVEPQLDCHDLETDDILMLCTDGLYNAIPPQELCALLTDGGESLERMVDQLLQTALEHGANDNLTVILYRHGGNATQAERR